MPANEDPADRDEDELTDIPQVPARPELPSPPDIQFTRPDLARTRGVGSERGRNVDSTAGNATSREASPISADQLGRAGAGLSTGLTFAACVIVGMSIGEFVDDHLRHFAPWGLLIFSLVGIAAGFVNLFRLLGALDRPDKKK